MPPRRKAPPPEATINKQIGPHHLWGEKRAGKWLLICDSWPDLAESHNGTADASACIDEFEQRATAQTDPDTKGAA